MSELEPTRTYSNPTATVKLRRLLDERGVEWGASDTYRLLVTSWSDASGHSWAFTEHKDGSFSKLTAYHLTPEQAIAATLGQAVRHPKPHEKWTTVLLPDIAWSRDDSWPDYLSVAHDTHGEWRTYVPEATLGAGSCKRVMDSIDPFAMWVCDHCGHPLDTSESFCGGCGRKVVAE